MPYNKGVVLFFIVLVFIISSRIIHANTITGDLKKWHKVTITFNGPETSEDAEDNPFMNYRLNVTFTHKQAKRAYIVLGYYTADGNASETGSSKGNKWRVHFTPPITGQWQYIASFRHAPGIAINEDPEAGTPHSFDKSKGTFVIKDTDASGRDHRSKGFLQYIGEHYLQFAETKEYYLKGGADSPENFLGYKDFDGTPNFQHQYTPHAKHFDKKDGAPYTWQNGKGKNILGAIKYLSDKGMNCIYFITMNAPLGDGKDVWMWTSENERYRFDCSKLDQWEKVFSYMDKKGIVLHLLTQETENDQQLDKGELGLERKLYYRELIARFSHHPALVWNIGEENTNTEEQQKAFSAYFKKYDPYKHPIVVHTFPNPRVRDRIYNSLLGDSNYDGPSFQTAKDISIVHEETKKWLARSEEKGHKWFVCIDEPGTGKRGTDHDARATNNQPEMRKEVLWGNLMAGGSGVEWYFGRENPHADLNCEDWTFRDNLWDVTRYALEFFHKNNIPFWKMESNDDLAEGKDNWCLALPGKIYVLYLKKGGSSKLNLKDTSGTFQVNWFDPRKGGSLINGTIKKINGGDWQSIGLPPGAVHEDWTVLIKK